MRYLSEPAVPSEEPFRAYWTGSEVHLVVLVEHRRLTLSFTTDEQALLLAVLTEAVPPA